MKADIFVDLLKFTLLSVFELLTFLRWSFYAVSLLPTSLYICTIYALAISRALLVFPSLLSCVNFIVFLYYFIMQLFS